MLIEFIIAMILRNSPISAEIGREEIMAMTIMVMNEAGGLEYEEQQVIMNVMLNRQRAYYKCGMYNTIKASMGVAYGHDLMNGFNSIEEAFWWYAGHNRTSTLFYKKGHPNFNAAFANVVEFLLTVPEDFTEGAVHFKHTASEHDAFLIVKYYSSLGEEGILNIIKNHGVEPFKNSERVIIGSIGVTVYSNVNLTPMLPKGE